MRHNLKISRQFSCILHLKKLARHFPALCLVLNLPPPVFGKIKLGAIWGSPRDHRFSPIALRQLFDYLRVIESWADLDGGGIFEAKAAKVKLPSLFGTGWQDGIPWLELHRGGKPVPFFFLHMSKCHLWGEERNLSLWLCGWKCVLVRKSRLCLGTR